MQNMAKSAQEMNTISGSMESPVSAEDSSNKRSELPLNESSKFLFDIFERSVEKLGPVDRQPVLEHQAKLMKSFTLLSEKIGEILSSDEGRRLMQQELQTRERSKK